MQTLSYGYRLIEDGDGATGDSGWFESIKFNTSRINTHDHDGVNSKSLSGYQAETYDNDVELDSDDLPSGGTPYGWNLNETSSFSNGGVFVGGENLSEGASTTKVADVLGTSTYCGFDGSSYLESTSSSFDSLTGDFTISLWAYHSSWAVAVAANETLISKFDGTDGWILYLSTAGQLEWETYNGGGTLTSEVRVGYTNLQSGYHHFSIVRDADTGTTIYIDGLRVAYVADTAQAITDAGNLEIGSYNGGTAIYTGRIDEVVVHDDKVYTNDQVARLYCRSARRKCSLGYDAQGSSYVEFVSPQEGAEFNYQVFVADNAKATFANTVATDFAEKSVSYRVFKNFVIYQGELVCDASPPDSIDTQLFLSVPIPCDNTDSYYGYQVTGLWADGGTQHILSGQIDSDSFFWYILKADATYTYRAKLTDTVPAAWANTDSIVWGFTYPTTDNKKG